MTTTPDEPIIAVDHVHHIRAGRFVCDAEPDAACRNYPACECEFWNEEHNLEHPPVPQPECWMVPWIEAIDLGDNYADRDTYWGRSGDWFPDGPVNAEWDSDVEGVTWTYADDTKPLESCDDCGEPIPHAADFCAACHPELRIKAATPKPPPIIAVDLFGEPTPECSPRPQKPSLLEEIKAVVIATDVCRFAAEEVLGPYPHGCRCRNHPELNIDALWSLMLKRVTDELDRWAILTNRYPKKVT